MLNFVIKITLLVLLAGPWSSAFGAGSVDLIYIQKEKRVMHLYKNRVPVKSYYISLGREPVGPKEQKGDGKTPEGTYYIKSKNANSQFHLSLEISYPNKRDRENAKRLGVDPGGDIFIHGMKNGLGWIGKSHLLYDWTEGCVAVTDKEIQEIWDLVDIGTQVVIEP